MPRSPTALAELRDQIAQRHPELVVGGQERVLEGPARLSTGIAVLDELLGGGFPLRSVSAWVGPPGIGWASLLRSVVHHRVLEGGRVAIVDGARSLEATDWTGLAQEDCLLFVRPEDPGQSPWAAEELAASGAFGLVVLDRPPQGFRRRSPGIEHRLRRAAGEGNSALLVIGSGSASFGAPLVLRGERAELSWALGHRALRMTRTRGGSPRDAEVVFDVEERLFACRLPVDPPVPDRRGPARRAQPLLASGPDSG